MERRRNKDTLFKSNFLFPEDFNTLPPIRLKINDYSNEILNDLIKLKDEKLLSNNNKNIHLSQKILHEYRQRNSTFKNNFTHFIQKTKSTFEKTNKSLTSREDPIKTKLKKIKLKLVKNELGINSTKRNYKYNLTNSNLGNEKIDKNDILNQLNEIDENTSLTNTIILRRNADHDIDIFKKIRKKLKSNKKKLFIQEDDYLKPEKLKPFNITKKKIFYSNLDNIIGKIKESSLSSVVLIEKMKTLNINEKRNYKSLIDSQNQEKNFKKFDEIISDGDLIKKEYDKNYEKIQKKLKNQY